MSRSSVVAVLVALLVPVLVGIGGCSAQSPTEVADAFVVAVQQGDTESIARLSESTLIQSPDVIGYANGMLGQNPGSGYLLDSEQDGFALVSHPESIVGSKLRLVQSDGKWLVIEIHRTSEEDYEEQYHAEPRVVETEMLPSGEEHTFPGQEGTRQVREISTVVNGTVADSTSQVLSVLEEAQPDYVIKGTGESRVEGVNQTVFAEGEKSIQRYRMSSGFAGVTRQLHEPGDRFQPYMIMPTGDVVMGVEVVWEGDWDEEAIVFLGAPREKNLYWEWSTDGVAAVGFSDVVENGWPEGGYVIGIILNGAPLTWDYYYDSAS